MPVAFSVARSRHSVALGLSCRSGIDLERYFLSAPIMTTHRRQTNSRVSTADFSSSSTVARMGFRSVRSTYAVRKSPQQCHRTHSEHPFVPPNMPPRLERRPASSPTVITSSRKHLRNLFGLHAGNVAVISLVARPYTSVPRGARPQAHRVLQLHTARGLMLPLAIVRSGRGQYVFGGLEACRRPCPDSSTLSRSRIEPPAQQAAPPR
jgi:hypothetical protein